MYEKLSFDGKYVSSDDQYSLIFRPDGMVEVFGYGHGNASEWEVIGNELIVKKAQWFVPTEGGFDYSGFQVSPPFGGSWPAKKEIFRIESPNELLWIATDDDRSKLSKDFVRFTKTK